MLTIAGGIILAVGVLGAIVFTLEAGKPAARL